MSPGTLGGGRRVASWRSTGCGRSEVLDRRGAATGSSSGTSSRSWRGAGCTFVAWTQADEVFVRHRVVGLPTATADAADRGHRPLVRRGGDPARTRGSSTSSSSGAVITGSGSTTRTTRGSPAARSGTPRSATALGYEVPDWARARPGRPAGGAGRADDPQPGPAAGQPGDALSAGAVRHGDLVPVAGGARRRRLPRVRVDEDRAGQPDPPAGHGGRRWWRSPIRASG